MHFLAYLLLALGLLLFLIFHGMLAFERQCRRFTRWRLRRAFRSKFIEFKKFGCQAAKANVCLLAKRLRDLESAA